MTQKREQAVSPVIAVILMVAVTVVLSAAIGGFVFNIGQSNSNNKATNLGVDISYSNGTVTSTIITGDADKVRLLIDGREEDNLTNPVPGDVLSASVASPNTPVTIVSIDSGEKTVITQTSVGPASPITIPQSGLVSWWAFDGDSDTTTVTDIVGSNDGSPSGTVYTSGYNGSAMEFSKTDNDIVTVPHSSSLNISSEITMSAWVYPTDTSTGATIASKATSYYFELKSGNPAGYTYYGTTSRKTSSYTVASSGVSLNSWTHVAFVEESDGTRHLYIDGELVTTENKESGIWQSTKSVGIGNNTAASGSSYAFDGKLDDVMIYNKSLSSENISKLYMATR